MMRHPDHGHLRRQAAAHAEGAFVVLIIVVAAAAASMAAIVAELGGASPATGTRPGPSCCSRWPRSSARGCCRSSSPSPTPAATTRQAPHPAGWTSRAWTSAGTLRTPLRRLPLLRSPSPRRPRLRMSPSPRARDAQARDRARGPVLRLQHYGACAGDQHGGESVPGRAQRGTERRFNAVELSPEVGRAVTPARRFDPGDGGGFRPSGVGHEWRLPGGSESSPPFRNPLQATDL